MGGLDQAAANDIRRRADLVTRVLETWNEQVPYDQLEPPPLYHYTDAAGLIGILEKGELWASAIGHSNDLKEITCAYEIARPILTDIRADARFQRVNQRNLLGFLEYFFQNPEEPMQHGYAVSFCARRDLLSQWRAYGQQGGFCIEFRPLTEWNAILNARIVPFRSDAGTKIIIRQINYAPQVQQQELRDKLVQASEFLHRMTEGRENDEITGIVNNLLSFWLVEWIYSVKDVAFEEEQEWRLICFPNQPWREGRFEYQYPDALRTRVRAGEIMPYVVLRSQAAPRLPIAGVMCGPASHPSLTKRAVELALKSKGYDCPVSLSRVPLRTYR